MPSVLDQFSKLTSTTLICICMGFFLPSLGTNSESECFSNVVALTILVVTIFVNVCIQLYTGVIILFREVHVFVLCSMMALLMIFWFYALDINNQKQYSLDLMKRNFTNGEKSMLHRLKAAYLYGYNANPQFVICRHSINATACTICALCSFVMFGTLASKRLDSCEKISDYKWSMMIIVVSQILTITAGTSATILRLVVMLGQTMRSDRFKVLHTQAIDTYMVMASNPLIRRSVHDYCIFIVRTFTVLCIVLIQILFMLVCGPIIMLIATIFHSGEADHATKEIKDFVHVGLMDSNEWTLTKGMKEMKRLAERVNQTIASSNHHLLKLLSPSKSHEDSKVHLLKKRYEGSEFHKGSCAVSSLTILILVRIATVCIPFHLSESLLKSLDEVFETIHFVDGKINPSNPVNKMRCRLAKEMWNGRSLSIFLPKIFDKSTNIEHIELQSQLERAILIIEGLKNAFPSSAKLVWEELSTLTDFITKDRVYGSIEDLYEFVKQLFVEMIKECLTQLPNAIYKDLVESNPEDFEGRVKFALEAVLKIEQLEGHVQWSFPVGTTINSLVVNKVPNMLFMRDMQLQSSKNAMNESCSTSNSDGHANVPMAALETIIEVD
ncbi:hypothetical protein Sjap_008496 [Stephania japonica]|uniref:Uncharacterized protein n=1 Tax=Stephania japonica TaxID=461633 RepID=A0AAP0PBE5_9MAGN